MKKFTAVLALCMIFSILLVSCDEFGFVPPEDFLAEFPSSFETEEPEQTTDPDEIGSEEQTTQGIDGSENEDTSEITTEQGTEPTVDPVKVVIAKSWDSMYEVVDGYEADAVFSDGIAYMTWETNAVVDIDHTTEALRVWGWIAYATETEGTVGYSINGGDVIYNEAFTFTAEEGVQTHIKNNVPGALSACRMKFDMPTADLKAGEYTFALVAKDPDGNEEVIKEFKVTKTMPYTENAHSNFSIDSILLNNVAYVTEGHVVAEMQAKNNTVVVMPTDPKESISMRGWAAFAAAPATEFGYFIGKNVEIVTDPAFGQDRPDLATAGIVNGAGYNVTASIADLPAGVYPVGVIAKQADGTYALLYSFYLQIVPECNEVTVDLGIRTSGGPYSREKKFGQKLPLGNNYLTGVTVKDMATYADGNVNTWSFKVWAWNTDYETTVAGTVLFELTGENHPDNSSFVVEIPFEKLITGDVYYEIEYLTGKAQFTGWTADSILVPGVETYVAGNLTQGTYASYIVVGVETNQPTKPENGSLEFPLTVTETLNAVAGLEEGQTTDLPYYTTGIVTKIGQTGNYYKNVYITDGENTMLVYTLNPMEGMPELKVGDTITVFGYIKNYNGTIEFASKYVDDAPVYVYIVAHEAAPVYEGKWHTSVDSFMYCVNDDFSDVVTFAGAATNNTNGTTIANASGSLASVTAKYVYFAGGWLAVDGYSLENFACDIYAADGTLLKTVDLALREAEEGVVAHVANNMKYAGVPNRLGNESEIIALGEYAGQTVKVVYRVDAVDTDYTINLIELEVIVP